MGNTEKKRHANASNRRLAKNILSGYVATALTSVTGFVVTPLLLRYLGSAQFGLWALLQSVLSYIALLEVGIYSTVSKRVADCIAREDEERLGRILGTSSLLYLLLIVLVMALVFLILPFFAALFHLSPQMASVAKISLVLLGFNRCALFLFYPHSAILFGGGRYDLTIVTQTLALLSASIFSAVLAYRGYGIASLAAVTLISTVVTGLLSVWFVARRFPEIKIRVKWANRETARDLVKFGSRTALYSLLGSLAYSSDTLFIANLMNTVAVAHYNIASRIASMVSMLAVRPILVLLPAYSHAEAQNDGERKFRLFVESVTLSLIICLPFTLATVLFGRELIRAWVGTGHQESYWVAVILLSTMLFVQPGNASAMLMNATDRNLFLVRAYAVAAPINLALSYWFTLKYGIIGPALGSMVTYLSVDASLLPFVTCRTFGFSYRRFLRESFMPVVPALLCGGICGMLFANLELPDTRTMAVLKLIGIIASCWGAFLLWGLEPERRQKYLRLLQKKRLSST